MRFKTLKKIETGKFVVSDTPEMCESCGSGSVNPFEIFFQDRSTNWCINCAQYCEGVEQIHLDEVARHQLELDKLHTEYDKRVKNLLKSICE